MNIPLKCSLGMGDIRGYPRRYPRKSTAEDRRFRRTDSLSRKAFPVRISGFAHNREPTEEEKDIVRRMASEFGTLYRRSSTCKRPKPSPGGLPVEAALEKVRTRTMAMQKGEELEEVVLLYKELMALGGYQFRHLRLCRSQ